MTKETVPQMLDDSVYRQYLEFIATGQYDRILDSLNAAAAFLEANPSEEDPADVSVGTIINIMVDSVKVMVGEVGTLGRTSQQLLRDPDERADIARTWQKWLHSLEILSLVIGEDLGPFPQGVREEYIAASATRRSHGTTERMLRLWKDSRPFMYKWLYFAKSQRQSRDEGEAHLLWLTEIMLFAHGLRENWNAAGRAPYDERLRWELDNAPWNEALRHLNALYDEDDQ